MLISAMAFLAKAGTPHIANIVAMAKGPKAQEAAGALWTLEILHSIIASIVGVMKASQTIEK